MPVGIAVSWSSRAYRGVGKSVGNEQDLTVSEQEDRLVLLLFKFLGPILTQIKPLICTYLCTYTPPSKISMWKGLCKIHQFSL